MKPFSLSDFPSCKKDSYLVFSQQHLCFYLIDLLLPTIDRSRAIRVEAYIKSGAAVVDEISKCKSAKTSTLKLMNLFTQLCLHSHLHFFYIGNVEHVCFKGWFKNFSPQFVQKQSITSMNSAAVNQCPHSTNSTISYSIYYEPLHTG